MRLFVCLFTNTSVPNGLPEEEERAEVFYEEGGEVEEEGGQGRGEN